MISSRERLMNAILEQVRETGYKNATTKKIAERVQMNEASIFRLFGNKDELFKQAVYLETVSRGDIDLNVINTLPSLKTRIEVLLASCMKISYKQISIFRAFMTYSQMFSDEQSHNLLARVTQIIEVMSTFFEDEYKKGNMREFDFYMMAELLFSRMFTASIEFTEKETDTKKIEPLIRQFISEYSDFTYNNFAIDK